MKLFGLTITRDQKPSQRRSFDGATGGRRASGMGRMGRANPEIAAAAQTVGARATYLAANNPWVSQGVANWVGALIGPGIMPYSQDAEALEIWDRWIPDADATGRSDFAGIQASLARSMIVAGEGLAIWTESGLRMLDPEQLDRSKTDGQTIFQGVEADDNGKPIAYWILPEKPASAIYQPPVRVGAADVIHLFRRDHPDQIRGMSWLAPIILSASELDAYADALQMSAKVAALMAVFVSDPAAQGDPDFELSPLEPGAVVKVPGGSQITTNSPSQLQQADSFLKFGLRQIAAGLGLPDHLVSGDLTDANYSSLRAGLIPFRQRVEQIQYSTIVPQLMTPVWRRVMTAAALDGDIDPQAAQQSIDWIMPKPLQVDPAKDIEATVAEIEAGLTSKRQAILERGWNPDRLAQEIALEQNKTESKHEQ